MILLFLFAYPALFYCFFPIIFYGFYVITCFAQMNKTPHTHTFFDDISEKKYWSCIEKDTINLKWKYLSKL